MYTTQSLSHFKSFPEALYSPPEGPNSGYLVIQDVDSETYSCFGLCKNRYLALAGLPFPQNKILTMHYGKHANEVIFIPVLNQPVSSNRYYSIKPHGSHKGEAFACSKEEDMTSCCFCNCVRDVKPRPLDLHDVYQQFDILPYETLRNGDGIFYAKSLADDGYPPYFLRRKGWQIYTKTPKNYELREAKGINAPIRSCLPDLNLPPSTKASSSVVIGKWYCPFVFIRDGRLADQVKNCIFYEMTLEQRWEHIFEQENENHNEGNLVSVRAAVRSEAAFVGESMREATWDESNMVDGVVWFTSFLGDQNEREVSIGLDSKIIERMRWEEERFGWVGGGEKRIARVNREEKYEGNGGWRRFSCYVLVERFVLKRMDGSLALAYDFAHPIKSGAYLSNIHGCFL